MRGPARYGRVLARTGRYKRKLVGTGEYKWRSTDRYGQVLAGIDRGRWDLGGSSGSWRVQADTATVRVQGSYLGADSELMLWYEFEVYGVEGVGGPCWDTSSGPML